MKTARWVALGSDGLPRSGWRVLLFFGPGMLFTIIGGVAALGVLTAIGWTGQDMPVPVLFPLFLGSLPVYLAFLVWGLVCSWLLDRAGARGAGMGGPAFRSGIEGIAGLGIGGALNVLGVLALAALGGLVGGSVDVELAVELSDIPWFFGWLAFFALAATWEEVLFRGYGFVWSGRMLANGLRWVAGLVGTAEGSVSTMAEWMGRAPVLVGSCAMFALVHLGNPGVDGALGSVNTFLAGLWLAIAVYRTRGLWFAVGLHLGWNATMGMVLGIPISGTGEESGMELPTLLEVTLAGPDWFTGTTYGLEASIGCTIALLFGCVISAFLPRRPEEESMPALNG